MAKFKNSQPGFRVNFSNKSCIVQSPGLSLKSMGNTLDTGMILVYLQKDLGTRDDKIFLEEWKLHRSHEFYSWLVWVIHVQQELFCLPKEYLPELWNIFTWSSSVINAWNPVFRNMQKWFSTAFRENWIKLL